MIKDAIIKNTGIDKAMRESSGMVITDEEVVSLASGVVLSTAGQTVICLEKDASYLIPSEIMKTARLSASVHTRMVKKTPLQQIGVLDE